MGRTEKSQGLAPPAVRKDIRAKQAKHVINKVIPALLASNSKARRGVESSELIVDPPPFSPDTIGKPDTENHKDAAYIKRKGQGRRKVKNNQNTEDEPISNKSKKKQTSVDLSIATLTLQPTPSPPSPPLKTRILTTDTLTAAHTLTFTPNPTPSSKTPKRSPNVCILNMASPLRPGGGLLSGATSQEEFLCARTTLHPSLLETYYRLPDFGGIWSPDVLVFHNSLPLGSANGELAVSERWWVSVISAGMLRFPELEGEEGNRRLGRKDKEMVEKKMRAVMRIAQGKGITKVVLGAWGCGAYGNPVIDIAEAWKKVLKSGVGTHGKGRRERETWKGIEEVVFAISQRGMAREFAGEFGLEVEAGPGQDDEDEEEDEDKVAEELRGKIKEMEGQVSQVWNPDLKARMGTILEGLKAQLAEREGAGDEGDEVGYEESSVGGVTPEQSGDEEEGENEDEDDYDESGEEDESDEELYERAKKQS